MLTAVYLRCLFCLTQAESKIHEFLAQMARPSCLTILGVQDVLFERNKLNSENWKFDRWTHMPSWKPVAN